jgi:Icc-related predicted phosphoesterase
MRIITISDTHSFLPNIPDCDLLLLAGDYSFCRKNDWRAELKWINKYFKPWLKSIQDRGITIAGCKGNHDQIWESHPELVQDLSNIFTVHGPKEVLGYKCFFSSYTITFYNWAFNLDEAILAQKWLDIPDDTEILVCHQPPYGYGDIVPTFCHDDSINWSGNHVGSPSLTERISELKNIKVVVFGHIHGQQGVYNMGNILLVNASYVDEDYKPYNRPLVVLENENKSKTFRVRSV